MNGPYLVIGATGNQGGAVVEALLATGARVRAFVRDPTGLRSLALAERGVELAPGDLTDSDRLAAAMDGAAAAFGLTTPGQDEVDHGLAIVAAGESTALPHLVLASVASAHKTTAVPHFLSKARIEEAGRSSRTPVTVVAPTWFFENLSGQSEEIDAGRLELALPADCPLQCLALADLGAIAAAIMLNGPTGNFDRVELAGDELTPADMAVVLSTATGRIVRPVQVALEEIALRSPDLAAMYRFLIDTGYDVDRGALNARFPAMHWHSFAQWAQTRNW
jgi:uncharacterized protein YbjT (DUF2867 family)